MLSHPLCRWLRLLLFSAVLVATSGCKVHLVGLHDIALSLRAGGAAMSADELAFRVGVRLAGAELAADVDADPSGRVTVRVDEEFAPEAERLLSWRGGLALAFVGDPPGVPDTEPLETAAVRLASAADPPGRRVTLQPVRGDSSAALARLRDVEWPPVAELDTDAIAPDGPTLVLPLGDVAQASLTKLAADSPDRPLGVVRDRTLLAILERPPSVADHRLVIPLGDSLVAYTEAADLARLLQTPKLPPLAVTARRSVPPDWLLAAGNVGLPFLVSVAWLVFVRRFDRAQPEPMWLVAATFVLGALAVIPAGLVEWGWDAISPYANPTLLTFGHSPRSFPVAVLGFIVTVGLTEEGMKLLAMWSLAGHRREFDEPVDGMVYAAAAALGFAAAENVRYLALGRVAGALVASRAFMSVPAHLFFSTIWGFALGRRLVEPEKRVWPLFLGAIGLHGVFDTLLAIDGGAPYAMLVGLVVSSIFILNLRLALRHGAVPPPDAPPLPARGMRELFRMGSRGVFAAFVVLVYLLSVVVFAITLLEHSGRAWTTFAVASAVVLGLLGWAARGVASTLPLDAVVDDVGVTFAGAAIPYGDVVRIERRKLAASPRSQEQMLIVGASRRLTIGPASGATIDALAHAVAMRLSSVGVRS